MPNRIFQDDFIKAGEPDTLLDSWTPQWLGVAQVGMSWTFSGATGSARLEVVNGDGYMAPTADETNDWLVYTISPASAVTDYYIEAVLRDGGTVNPDDNVLLLLDYNSSTSFFFATFDDDISNSDVQIGHMDGGVVTILDSINNQNLDLDSLRLEIVKTSTTAGTLTLYLNGSPLLTSAFSGVSIPESGVAGIAQGDIVINSGDIESSHEILSVIVEQLDDPVEITPSTALADLGGSVAGSLPVAIVQPDPAVADVSGSAQLTVLTEIDNLQTALADLDGSAVANVGASFKWSVAEIKAEIARPGETIYVELSNEVVPPVAFPEGVNFEKRILELPVLSETDTNSFLGVSSFDSIQLVVDNADGFLNTFDMQSFNVRVRITSEGSEIRNFVGKVTSWTLGVQVRMTVESVDQEKFNLDIPRRKIEVGLFPSSSDLGQSIPVYFGRAVKAPLLYVGVNEGAREYDYLIGEGVGLNGNNFNSVTRVYRNDSAMDIITGNSVSDRFEGGKRIIELEAGDQRPSGWYNYWWIINLDTGGILDVESYDGVANEVTLSAGLSWGNNVPYELKEYRFYDGSQGSPYPGYAFIRLKKPMSTGSSLDRLTADVNGLQDETNPVRLIESLLTNTSWGLGLTVDSTSFATASGDSLWTSLKSEGGFVSVRTAINILNDLLSFRDMRLFKNDEDYEIELDGIKTLGKTFNWGGSLGDKVLSNTVEVINRHPDEIVKDYTLQYRRNFSKNGEYLNQNTRNANSLRGTDKVQSTEYVYDHTSADVLVDYKRKRFECNQSYINLVLPMEAIMLTKSNYLRLIAPDLSIDGSYELREFNIGIAGRVTARVKPYSASIYTYEPSASLPNDGGFDIPTDFENTAPDPVASLSITKDFQIVNDTIRPVFKLSWIPPDSNFSTAIVKVKLSSDPDTAYEEFTRGQDGAVLGEGIDPSLIYDIAVIALGKNPIQESLPLVETNQILGDDNAPGSISGLSSTFKHGRIIWDWNRRTETDIKEYQIEIYNSSSGGNPVKEDTVKQPSNTSTNPTYEFDAQQGNLTSVVTRYLRVRAIDNSGNPGPWTSRDGQSTGPILQNDITNGEITGFANLVTSISPPSGSVQRSIVTRGQVVDVELNFYQPASGGTIVTLTRNGSQIFQQFLNVATSPGAYVFHIVDQPSAGTNTYQVSMGNVTQAISVRLNLQERRR